MLHFFEMIGTVVMAVAVMLLVNKNASNGAGFN
jgi:hypothetical protein